MEDQTLQTCSQKSVPCEDDVSKIDDHYVRCQARQLIVDHAQMQKRGNDEQKLQKLRLSRHVNSEDMNARIDEDASLSSVKKGKSWKQMDMYLKWNSIMSYLTDKKCVDIAPFKEALQEGLLDNVIYDSKSRTILCLNYGEL